MTDARAQAGDADTATKQSTTDKQPAGKPATPTGVNPSADPHSPAAPPGRGGGSGPAGPASPRIPDAGTPGPAAPARPSRPPLSVADSQKLIANVAKMPPQARQHPTVQADLAPAQRVVAEDGFAAFANRENRSGSARSMPNKRESDAHGASSPSRDLPPKPPNVTRHVAGTGSLPTVRWNANPEGTPLRTPEQAVLIAREHGIHIPSWVTFRAVPAEFYGVDTWAKYASFYGAGNKRIMWKDFCNDGNRVSIGIDERILNSDEGIVGVIAHEMHEINALRGLLHDNDGGMSLDRLAALIQGPDGTLHQEAWDVSDSKITEMRKAGYNKNIRQF